MGFIFLLNGNLMASDSTKELAFNFETGSNYSYSYKTRSNSKSTLFDITNNKENKTKTAKFDIKCIAYQNDAFILDIKKDNLTIRRYLKKNGELKGSPSEVGVELPFFITFPNGNWKVSQTHKTSKNIRINNVNCPATWLLTLRSLDPKDSLAIIDFSAQVNLPQDQTRKKSLKLEGKVWFDYFKGNITKANWISKYNLNFSNKEIAVIRDLWTIETNSWHSLELLNTEDKK